MNDKHAGKRNKGNLEGQTKIIFKQGLVGYGEDFGFYDECDGNPLKNFKAEK